MSTPHNPPAQIHPCEPVATWWLDRHLVFAKEIKGKGHTIRCNKWGGKTGNLAIVVYPSGTTAVLVVHEDCSVYAYLCTADQTGSKFTPRSVDAMTEAQARGLVPAATVVRRLRVCALAYNAGYASGRSAEESKAAEKYLAAQPLVLYCASPAAAAPAAAAPAAAVAAPTAAAPAAVSAAAPAAAESVAAKLGALFATALTNPAVQSALTDPAVLAALANPDVQATLTNREALIAQVTRALS